MAEKKLITEYDRLLKEFRTIAKRADERLVRLEQAGLQKTGTYRSAMMRIRTYRETGSRFNVKLPKDTRTARARINIVREWLAEESSTATGRHAIYKRVMDTLRTDHGLDIKTESELKAVFEKGLWDDLNSRFGSDTAMQILTTVQQSKETVGDALRSARDAVETTEEMEAEGMSFISDVEISDAEAIFSQHLGDKNIKKIFGL